MAAQSTRTRHRERIDLRGPVVVVFAALSILDGVTTQAGLALGITEGNPMPARLLEAYGLAGMWAAKAAVSMAVVALVWALPRYPRLRYSLIVTSAVLALAVASNGLQAASLLGR